MLIEPKLTNTSKNFGKPPEKQNPVNISFYNLTIIVFKNNFNNFNNFFLYFMYFSYYKD